MAFSTQVRLELAKVPCEKKCCAVAELSGAALVCGGLSFKGLGRYGLEVTLGGVDAAQRACSLFRRFLRCECALTEVRTARLGGLYRYAVTPPDHQLPQILKELRLLDKNQPFGLRAVPAPEILKNDCCRRAFLRGAFLAGGSTGDPQKAYHLEIAVPDLAMAECVSGIMEGFDLPGRVAGHRSRTVVYLKDAEHMASLLTLMGAHRALLELENVRIYKEIRNGANRQANCDTANVEKTVAAAQKQLSILAVIDEKMGLENLPAPLRDIADLRRRYPEATLTELGGMATPPVGKSGVNARMRKLEALAEELVNA